MLIYLFEQNFTKNVATANQTSYATYRNDSRATIHEVHHTYQ